MLDPIQRFSVPGRIEMLLITGEKFVVQMNKTTCCGRNIVLSIWLRVHGQLRFVNLQVLLVNA